MPRSMLMAEEASTMPADRSSSRSVSSTGSSATTVGFRRSASSVPMAKSTPLAPTLQAPPPTLSSVSPTGAATTAARAESTVSFELASTSSSSLWTVPGTTALFEIA